MQPGENETNRQKDKLWRLSTTRTSEFCYKTEKTENIFLNSIYYSGFPSACPHVSSHINVKTSVTSSLTRLTPSELTSQGFSEKFELMSQVARCFGEQHCRLTARRSLGWIPVSPLGSHVLLVSV